MARVDYYGFVLCFAVCIFETYSAPQYYLHEAVKQAHSMKLLPHYAVVDKTAPGIQVGYYSIGPYERASLHSALGGMIPMDVVKSLESTIDAIGMGSYQIPVYQPKPQRPQAAQPQPQQYSFPQHTQQQHLQNYNYY